MSTTDTPCRRGCCWTPYGHSTVRDGITAPALRCKCHDGPERLEPKSLLELLAELDG